MFKTCLQFSIAASTLFIGLNLIDARPAKAIINTYDFEVLIDSGSLDGNTYSGSFEFDDSSLNGTGDEFIPVTTLNYSFIGTNYTEADDPSSGPEVAFNDGDFLGLGYSTDDFSFVPGFFSPDDGFYTYDVNGGVGSGTGDITYNNTTVPVPFEVNPAAGIFLLGSLFMAKKAYRRYRASKTLIKD